MGRKGWGGREECLHLTLCPYTSQLGIRGAMHRHISSFCFRQMINQLQISLDISSFTENLQHVSRIIFLKTPPDHKSLASPPVVLSFDERGLCKGNTEICEMIFSIVCQN